MAWIGPRGNLFEFRCPSALDTTPADGRVLFTSMAGRVSVTDLAGGQASRSWDVSVSTARPEQVAALRALSMGEFGPGPFVFIPPAAESLNLLGRGAAVCLGEHTQHPEVTTGGVVVTSEGPAGRSLLRNAAPFVTIGSAPVIPGRKVSVRVWAVGTGAQVRITPISTRGEAYPASTSVAVNAGTGAWVTHTMDAPADAMIVTVDVLGAMQVARPSVTWDAPARVWSPSAASQSVSVPPLPERLLRATGKPGAETLADHTFTIQEVG